MRPLTALLAGVLALECAAPVAMAQGLTGAERDRLARGETVVRPQSLSRGAGHYVGGVTYSIVDAQADDVARLLGDVDVWRQILPNTRAAHRIGKIGDDLLVELTNGTSLFQATYTLRMRREGRLLRFWMDPNRPHDIHDAWGFVRADSMADGRTLVTYGVLVDMGGGLLRDLFEERVRQLALSVPDRVRGFVLERNAAGRRASM